MAEHALEEANDWIEYHIAEAAEKDRRIAELTALARNQDARIRQLTALLDTQLKTVTALADLDEKRREEIAGLKADA